MLKNRKYPLIVSFILICLSTGATEKVLTVTGRYLNIPVSHACDRQRLLVKADGMDDMPIVVRVADGNADYWVFKDVSSLKGKKLTISTGKEIPGLESVCFSDELPGIDSLYAEKNRPQFHFTTRCGWINDPNGLIYDNGKYHLYYQHNPYERDWENMHWGHAISPDLIHWTEYPDALYPDTMGTMFSGSAVIDYDNTSGFGKKGIAPMVAAYTAETGERQVQCIAYSLDGGMSFTKYKGNPVVDSKEVWNSRDTRDPKVFRYDDHWVMVLNERDGHSIYTSDNLRDWTYRSHTTGFWECPELFALDVDGKPDKKLWVMYGASGTYMLGDFDGYTFTPVSGKHRYASGSIYAAQTYNNIPGEDGRRIQIGWGRLSHPGMHFNGMMLLPTELTLRTTKDGPRLVSVPVREVEQICHLAGSWQNLDQRQADDVMKQFAGSDGLRIKVTIGLSHATDAYIAYGGQRILDYDMNGTTVNGWHYSPQNPTSMEISADIFIDRTSAEVFIDGGLFSFSMGRAVDSAKTPEFIFGGNNLEIKDLQVYKVDSIWNDRASNHKIHNQ